jgi:signal transduction histidine kinase
MALLACGVAAHSQRERRANGEWWLLLLAGFTWLAGSWIEPLVHAHRGPLVHLLLSHPGVRPRPRSAMVIVAVAYIDGLVPVLARADGATLVLAACVLGCAIQRYRAARGRERRARRAALWAAVGVTGVLGTAAAASLLGADPGDPLLLAYDVAVAGAGLVLAAELLAGGAPERAMAGVVADLGDVEAPGSLPRRLAAALGDPELVVAYRLPASDGYVDEAGRPVSLPSQSSGRAVTAVEEAGERVAVIVHDDLLSADAALLTAAAGTVRLTTANARMQAEIRARISATAASRRRLVTAADEERRRFEALLRAGAERQLQLAASQLEQVRDRATDEGRQLSEVAERLRRARQELRRFAMGVHPAALTDSGLDRALAELAAESAVPVELSVLSERLETEVETAAYFACAEALANVAKHAEASRVEVRIERRGDRLVVEVRDDGLGGAREDGSGLRGLADRVEALGGQLSLHSPKGVGTRLMVELPLAATRDGDGAAA